MTVVSVKLLCDAFTRLAAPGLARYPLFKFDKKVLAFAALIFAIQISGFGSSVGHASSSPGLIIQKLENNVDMRSLAEGLYDQDQTLIVVARQNGLDENEYEDVIEANLITKITSLMNSYVVGSQEKRPDGDFETLYQAYLTAQSVNGELPRQNKQIMKKIEKNSATLVLAFFDGTQILKKARVQFMARLPDMEHAFIADVLKQDDIAKKIIVAQHLGLIFEEIRLRAEKMDRAKLAIIPKVSHDILEYRDLLLEQYCDGRNCALRPETALAMTQEAASKSDRTSLLFGLVAHVTSRDSIREKALNYLEQALSTSNVDREFSDLLKKCDGAPKKSTDQIRNIAGRNCGFIWQNFDRLKEDLSDLGKKAESSFQAGGQPSITIDLIDAALSESPATPILWSYAGSVLQFLDRNIEAVACFHQALLLDPHLVDTRFNLAAIYERLGYSKLALASYRDVMLRLENGEKSRFGVNLISKVTSRIEKFK